MTTETEEVVTTETREYHVCDFCGCRVDLEPLTLALEPQLQIRPRFQTEAEEMARSRTPRDYREFTRPQAIRRSVEFVEICTRKEMDLCRCCERSLFEGVSDE